MPQQLIEQTQAEVPMVTEAPVKKEPVAAKAIEPTAPTPHPITILIGVISPSLAVVALVMSILSLNTSRDSLRIGQRAYIRVDASLLQEPKHPDIWTIGVVFRNSGNTPGALIAATAKSIDMDGCSGDPNYIFTRFVNDWTTGLEEGFIGDMASAGKYMKRSASRPPCTVTRPAKLAALTSVGGKDSSNIDLVSFNIPALWHGREFDYITLPNVESQFTYRDVFGVEHHGSGVCKFEYDAGVVMYSCVTGD